jgi:hypothetical protein
MTASDTCTARYTTACTAYIHEAAEIILLENDHESLVCHGGVRPRH